MVSAADVVSGFDTLLMSALPTAPEEQETSEAAIVIAAARAAVFVIDYICMTCRLPPRERSPPMIGRTLN